jgi:hypothetical protein
MARLSALSGPGSAAGDALRALLDEIGAERMNAAGT